MYNYFVSILECYRNHLANTHIPCCIVRILEECSIETNQLHILQISQGAIINYQGAGVTEIWGGRKIKSLPIGGGRKMKSPLISCLSLHGLHEESTRRSSNSIRRRSLSPQCLQQETQHSCCSLLIKIQMSIYGLHPTCNAACQRQDVLQAVHLRRILSANSDMVSDMISEKNSEIVSEFMSEFISEVPLRTSFQK